MLLTTRGIVFNQVKYGETSIIARIYTEHSGLQSFLIRGARSRHSRIRSAHLQHLSLVELEFNQRSNKEIQHLKSLKIAHPFRDIPFNVKKSAVAVFLNEILFKVIREEEANPALFSYLFNTIQFLDLKAGHVGLFHHLFLIQLSRHLGFFPRNNFSGQHIHFDLQEGEFTASESHGELVGNQRVSEMLHDLMQLNFDDLDGRSTDSALKQELLDLLLRYYRLHIPGFGTIRSHLVLSEVFGK
jgi:DNA repair protein RecO (recombination protein O)